MTNARMWLVVKPTVGIPLFLSAVAVGSFAMHVAVLGNTSWVADFLSGKKLGSGTASAELILDQDQAAKAAYVLPSGSQEVLIRMPDGTTARAILQMPEAMASLNQVFRARAHPGPRAVTSLRKARLSSGGRVLPVCGAGCRTRHAVLRKGPSPMFDCKRFALGRIASFGTRYMPFADVASEAVPLARLLRLSLFQMTVGMALVLMVGTLNRVMTAELKVPATLLAAMLALPLVFAPFRALIGFRSDAFRSALGLRRLPCIWKGTMLQFGGFAIMPFALLVLSGYGEAIDAPRWLGLSAAALAFLLVGAGVHMVQTVGLALAMDLVPVVDQPKVVGLMYVMLPVGMIISAFAYGALLETYTPGRLIQVIQGSAVVTIAVNGCAMWKQEARNRSRATAPPPDVGFLEAWARLAARRGMIRLLAVIGLGTAGFGMAGVLLEPFGGQVLAMTVAQTTRLTVVLAFGSLIGFGHASRWLGRGGRPMDVVCLGAGIGMPAFGLVLASALVLSAPVLVGATLMAGFGAGLFGHGTLTATMRAAPREQIGLSLGAWGAVQATAAGLAIAVGGVIRDVVLAAPLAGATPASPCVPVFCA